MRAVLCYALAASIGCSEEEPRAAEAPTRFALASPEVRDASISREYVADIRAVRHIELRSRIKGVLETVTVDEGQAVKAGQTLFAINARALKQAALVARAATLGAEAELKAAQLELQNTKVLQQKRVVSDAEVAFAESKVQTLRAKVEEARANAERASLEVGYAEIKAPFDGVVNRVPRKAGSAVAEDELLTTLTDTREVFAYFRITEREYLAYRAIPTDRRPAVALRLADGSVFTREGVVDAITSEFDRETGTLAYRARVPNADGTLKHGSSGKVVLTTDLPNAMLVPQRSTFDVQGDLYVYVVDASQVPRARRITVKARLNDAFVVEQGLAPEDQFVLDGIQKIKEGARIELAGPPATAELGAHHGG